MSIFKEPKREPPKMKLDDAQKGALSDSKWVWVIISTVVCFGIGGGYRLILPNEITNHFHGGSTAFSTITVWLQFLMFFGLIPAIFGFIVSSAVIDYVTHSKGNRR